MGHSYLIGCRRCLKRIGINMKGVFCVIPIILLISPTKCDFAAQLATFINETPTGYTVAREVKDGQNCHCRVPASSSSSMAQELNIIGYSSSATATAEAGTLTTTAAPTTTDAPTTTAAPTTTDVPTTTGFTTTVITNSAGSTIAG